MSPGGDKWPDFPYKGRLALPPQAGSELFEKPVSMNATSTISRRGLWLAEMRASLMLAWPLVLSQIAQASFFTTDVVLLGWVGPQSLAGISLAMAMMQPLLIGGFGVVTAAAPMVSQALGAGEVKSVRRTVRQSLWVAIFISVLVIPVLILAEHILPLLGQPPEISDLAARYLDYAAVSVLPALAFMVLRLFISAKGNTGAVLAIVIVAVSVNGVLAYALIFGAFGLPALGIVGAGIAASAANTMMFILGAAYAIRHRKYRRHMIFVRFFKPDWPRFREIFRIGAPIGLTNISEVGLFGLAVFMMGWIGSESVAAHAIAVQCASLSFMVPLGLSQAATIRVGLARGARDREGVGRTGWVALVMSLMFMSMTFSLFVFAPRTLASLFLDASRPENADVIALAASFLVVAGLFQFFDGTQVAMAAALRGLSDTRVPMVIAMVGYWLVGLTVAYFFGFVLGWQGTGIWAGLAAGLGFVAIVLLNRWTRREELGLVGC